jgi:hypothetical protein
MLNSMGVQKSVGKREDGRLSTKRNDDLAGQHTIGDIGRFPVKGHLVGETKLVSFEEYRFRKPAA